MNQTQMKVEVKNNSFNFDIIYLYIILFKYDAEIHPFQKVEQKKSQLCFFSIYN
jgi:hypothetical protein